MSRHQELVEEMLGKIETRKSSYGSVLVKSAILKEENVWHNTVSILVPLHKSDSYVPKPKLDYGDLIFFEELVSLKTLIRIIKALPEKGVTTIALGSHKVQVNGQGFQNGHEYDSGERYLNIGWFFERYRYSEPSKSYRRELIVSRNLPLFPDFRRAVTECLDVDIVRYSDLYGLVICLPRYGAKIEEVNIGSKETRVGIMPRDVGIENILGKLYCERGEETKHADIEFKDNKGTASIGFMPDSMYVALVSKTDNKILDSRRYYSSWGHAPKGVVVDIPQYEIVELVRRGEMETVEFKEDIGKPEEFAETVVAFANGEGGVILIGVDDHAKVVGLGQRDYEDTITNILRSHCDPQVKYDMTQRPLEEKSIIVLRVEEGKDKPYFVKNRGAYIRANATDRIATRYEMDEIYRQRQF